MAAILVYAELNQGKVATTSLELMTRARELGDVYAVALGAGAKAAAATLGKHGAKAVHVNEDPAFDDYIAEPATDALAALYEKERPDLILFAFTSDSREVAGRLAARLGAGLISNASDVVAKGRGMGGPQNFPLLEDLASALGGAVGASRAVVDAGWVPYSMQVGRTGKSVRPGVYIAVGISGAMQHTVGMKTSKVIIAINKDAEAPIMKMADLGVVGDALKIVPALTAAVKAKKNG